MQCYETVQLVRLRPPLAAFVRDEEQDIWLSANPYVGIVENGAYWAFV